MNPNSNQETTKKKQLSQKTLVCWTIRKQISQEDEVQWSVALQLSVGESVGERLSSETLMSQFLPFGNTDKLYV